MNNSIIGIDKNKSKSKSKNKNKSKNNVDKIVIPSKNIEDQDESILDVTQNPASIIEVNTITNILIKKENIILETINEATEATEASVSHLAPYKQYFINLP